MKSSKCNEFYENDEFVLDVWGKFACFTRPTSKVERVTYDVITPSAARGIVEAIYWKPEGFYYQITRVEIMKPIRYLNVPRKKIKNKLSDKVEIEPLYTKAGSDANTIRYTVYLRDVYYRIYGKIICSDEDLKHKFYTQLERRIKSGKCFCQPYLGTRECMAYFSYPREDMEPISDLHMDLGEMLYDVFDIKKHIKLDTRKKFNNVADVVNVSAFSASVLNGVMIIPEYKDSHHITIDKAGDSYV